MPHLTWGGGIGTELNKFDLQRFAEVENPYETIINSNIITNGLIQQPLVDLSYYAENNIANYRTIIKIPQENIEYLSSGLAASNCRYMFYYCKQLTSIPWNEFNIDTSQCTSMRYMFYHCEALNILDLSNFNTSKVTDMNGMFYQCEALTSLDLSNFDTSKVTDMSNMFCNCNALTSLDISNFDTSKVKNMEYMFQNCTALTSLNLSNFDTSQVTSMGYMFQSCKSLQEIICPNGFDMSSCTDVYYMFTGCTSYNGEPLHFKNVLRNLDFSVIGGTEGTHYVIDNYID